MSIGPAVYIGYGISLFVFLVLLVVGIVLIVNNVRKNKTLQPGVEKKYTGMIIGIILLVLSACLLSGILISLLFLLFRTAYI